MTTSKPKNPQPKASAKIHWIKILKYLGFAIGVLILLVGGLLMAWSHDISNYSLPKGTITDVGRLHPTKVKAVRQETKQSDLVAIIKDASERGLKVSIAGSQHSQGGHTYYDNAVVLDMRSFKKIKSLDMANKVLVVEAGATWHQIQDYIAPKGLAVKGMQSSYVFTVGGTLSANAHGRDMDSSSVVETVQSLRLLKADGSIVNVSRTENHELFRHVIGGYGMFGVILDVTLTLTGDPVYEKRSADVNYRSFPGYFTDVIQKDPTAKMMLVRPNVDVHSDKFLKDFVVSTWHSTNYNQPELHKVKIEKNVLRDKFFFDLSRRYDWAKSLRWNLQKKLVEEGGDKYISRNNAMRPPETPLEFLDYHSKNRTDIIQEYYVPTKDFVPFMDEFRKIIVRDEVNIISSTIRYVKANNETVLPYAPHEDAFSIIVMSNIGLDQASVNAAQATTRKLVQASIDHGGTYYLTYQLFPSNSQLRQAYPNIDRVFAAKKRYDPAETFMSQFYAQYAQGKEIPYGKP